MTKKKLPTAVLDVKVMPARVTEWLDSLFLKCSGPKTTTPKCSDRKLAAIIFFFMLLRHVCSPVSLIWLHGQVWYHLEVYECWGHGHAMFSYNFHYFNWSLFRFEAKFVPLRIASSWFWAFKLLHLHLDCVPPATQLDLQPWPPDMQSLTSEKCGHPVDAGMWQDQKIASRCARHGCIQLRNNRCWLTDTLNRLIIKNKK